MAKNQKKNNDNSDNAFLILPLIVFVCINVIAGILLWKILSIWYLVGACAFAVFIWCLEWDKRKKNVEILNKQCKRNEQSKNAQVRPENNISKQRVSKHNNYRKK